MHQSARQAAILKSLEVQGICTVVDLAAEMAVSDETIRRDIKVMANKGLVERVHGGVLLPELFREPDFQKRMNRNAAAKQAIARLAAACVANGETLMMDTGSTTAYVARALAGHADLMVVTNCTGIAGSLSPGKGTRVYLTGGEFRSDDGAVLGASAIEFVKQFRVRLAILSMGAINLEDGLMDFHLGEAEFSRAIIAAAKRVIVVADHTKFDAQAPVRVCGVEDIDTLITERPPQAPYAERLAEAGVGLLTATS